MAIDAAILSKLSGLSIAGNSGKAYLIALGIFVALLVGLKIFKIYILSYLKKFARKSKTELDDALIDFVDGIDWKFFVFVSFFISVKALALPAAADKAVNYALLIILVYYGTKFLHKIIDYYAKKQIEKRLGENKDEDTSLIDVLGRIVKLVVWVIAILLVLSNLGFNITSLVAGLGIGGIAVAFALQNILQDLFSSFTIYFDKPFRKGDFIIIGQDMGTVKHIGIKSTRIQTLQGQELIVSNRELTNARINNYKKMEKRRIVFSFGVEYGTSTRKLKAINSIITGIFKKMKSAELDRVHFKEFGSFSLDYEVVYYLNTNDYTKYMDAQQEINLAIKEQFEKHGIGMAFPTQTIHIRK